MSVVHTRPKTPLLTVGVVAVGIASIIAGLSIFFTRTRPCVDFCKPDSNVAGVALFVWGVVGCLAGLRGRVGLVALITTIVAPLAISWRYFFPILGWLILVFGATSASKETLAPYYRSSKGSS